MFERLPNACVYDVEETQKFVSTGNGWKIHCEQLVSSVPNERETNFSQGSSKFAPQRNKSGEKVSKLGLATEVPASSRRSCLHWTRSPQNADHADCRLQTADCRLQTVQIVQTVQTEYFFSDTIVFEFAFDSNFCRSSYKILLDISEGFLYLSTARSGYSEFRPERE